MMVVEGWLSVCVRVGAGPSPSPPPPTTGSRQPQFNSRRIAHDTASIREYQCVLRSYYFFPLSRPNVNWICEKGKWHPRQMGGPCALVPLPPSLKRRCPNLSLHFLLNIHLPQLSLWQNAASAQNSSFPHLPRPPPPSPRLSVSPAGTSTITTAFSGGSPRRKLVPAAAQTAGNSSQSHQSRFGSCSLMEPRAAKEALRAEEGLRLA